MNNRLLPTRFSVKPLALLVPIASLAIASSFASAQSEMGENLTISCCAATYSSVFISDSSVNSVTVTSSGRIAVRGPAINVSGGGTLPGGILNQGALSASNIGISVFGSGVIVQSITNTGTINASSGFSSSDSAARAIEVGFGATVGSISNSGTIDGDISLHDGAQVTGAVSNSGLIDGEVYLSDYSSFSGTYSGTSGSSYTSGIAPEKTSIGSLTNSGTITAGLFVEESEIKGNVTNVAGGEIRDGIAFDRSSFGGDLTNAGLITLTDGGPGFDAIPATITINGNFVPGFFEIPWEEGGEMRPNDEGGEGLPPVESEAIAPIELTGKIVNEATGSITNTAASVMVAPPSESEPMPLFMKPSVEMTDPAAIYLNYVNMADGIYNDGLISSTNGSGIRIENGSVDIISNNAGGTISGGNGYAIFIDDTASLRQVNNAGTINGILDFGGNGGFYNATGGTSDEVINATSLQIGAATTGAAGPLTSTINGDFTFSGPMTFEANGFDGGVRYGQLATSGNAAVNGSLTINVSGDTFFSNNDVLELIKADGTLSTDIASAVDNSLLLEFSISKNANSLLATVAREDIVDVIDDIIRPPVVPPIVADDPPIVTFLPVAEITSLQDITSPGVANTLGVAGLLDSVVDLIDNGEIAEDSELGQTLALLQGIEDPVELVQAVKSLEPEASGAGSEGSKAAAGAVSAVIANRQASLRNSVYETGMVAGDDIAITGFWIQGYDKDTEQEVREGIDGYDVDMYGIALGADAPVGERATVGVAISYADSQVDSTGIENNEMGIDSYQISSYVSFNEDDYYLDALVSFARNEYDGKRNLFNGLIATSDYSGDQYGARARGGYPFVFESGVHVTPNTSIEYSYLKEESYSEDGAGNSGLEIGSQTLEALVWAAGVKVAYPFTTESDTTWMPDFHVEVRHDFIGDEVELDTNFVGVGGAGFSTNGASVETTAYKAGIGLRAWSQSSLSFMVRYDYTYKKDYNSQAVAATMRYSF
jgi:outer membrane autotransporter protein